MPAPTPLHESRLLGRTRIHALQAGGQRLDGGAMFGVVPKVLWERRIAADEFFKGLYETALGADEIVTAVSFPVPRKAALPEPNAARRSLSAIKIKRHCEGSLKRLQTDHIDLYQMHHVDRACPSDEIWQSFDALVRQGKIVYVGSSNFAGWDIATAFDCHPLSGTIAPTLSSSGDGDASRPRQPASTCQAETNPPARCQHQAQEIPRTRPCRFRF